MIALVLQFYIPAFVATFILALIISVIYTLFFFTGKKSKQIERASSFFHELLILNLLTIPVVSFALVALFIVIRAIRI